ncbi:phytoene/squalene synthetase [Rhodovulum imhoffii]|uniref:Phytoene/squalene synthetase n=2 Tax=Rhodovulum imhoffii TaxID=365340 RepID=A0A2T5BTC7_9RHOB|nr:phytoene/squalene synthetase [Rhodovulum imhoffii]
MVRRGDPDRFRAAMAASPVARAVLLPIYAFNLEVARAPWLTQEALIAEMRLQWWRDALEEIASGAPVRRHEVTVPLAGVLPPDAARLLDGLVAARRWDIYRESFADAASFDAHIEATSGHLMWAAVRALGVGEGEAVVRDFAFATGVANWLRAVPELASRGCLPLVDDRAEAVAALSRRALARLHRARRARAQVPPTAAPALLAGWGSEAVLKAAAADPARVANGTLAPAEFIRRGGLILRSLSGRW